MIPIGGIQMVHSVPTSVTDPLAQQGAQSAPSRLFLQKSTSEDSLSGEASSFTERGRRGGAGGERGRESTSPHPPSREREGRQEETIHTCTKAIASLCINSEESAESRGGGSRGEEGRDRARAPPSSSSPSALSSDCTSTPPRPPSSPQPPGIQHFSGLELRPPHPTSPHSSSPSPHPHSLGSDPCPPPTCVKLEGGAEQDSTKRLKDVS